MQSAQLRERFLSFFESHGHTRKESDGLIPSGDPTVLFTSAGMNQFKDYFLGKRTDLTRAVSCQKCLRTGDLDKVGKTASHHSFFEMLGNFSFGDYFKKEAIGWAWEFLTGTVNYAGAPSDRKDRCLSLLKEKLWVSIYEKDEEAYQLWRKLGMPDARLKRFGPADNFWPANAPTEGPNGPCGPCSEIYYDPDGKVQGPQSVEVWNLVFTQFDRQPDGTLKPLPKPNIDTGMGLERLTRVEQEVSTDYETDLFLPIIETIRSFPRVRKRETKEQIFAERAIADHVRAIVFLVTEGVIPSNESRGYVLRALVRRAYRLGVAALDIYPERLDKRTTTGFDLHSDRAFLCMLVKPVLTAMKRSPYSGQLETKYEHTVRTLEYEEAQFVETLESGESRLLGLIEKLKTSKSKVIPGEEAFKLYDTYGFPLESTVDIAEERGLTVDRAGFATALNAQQERSRSASQFGGEVFVTDTLPIRQAIPSLPPKEQFFVGYEGLQVDAVIQGLWDGKAWVNEVTAGQSAGVVLNRSPFYGEAGGQGGDTGRLEGPKGIADVQRTTWVDDVLVHHAVVRQGGLRVQETVRACVDAERRLKIARSHTAAHMLHWALRKVLGPDAVQAGSFVESERVRFDFSSLEGLHEEQRHQVETLVNSRVGLADAVQAAEMRLEEAKRSGALALFGEKYGNVVRVVTIGDYSKELCGGTHVLHTGFVGTFIIVGESSIAAGTRRIEALVGEAAAAQQSQQRRLLHEVAARLGRPSQEVLAGLENLLEQLKRAERERRSLQLELAKVHASQLVAEGKKIDGVTFVVSTIKQADRELLSALADAIKNILQRDGAVLLASAEGPANVSFVMATTSDLAKRLHAGELLKAIAPLAKGSGGGRPDFAQAGGKDPSAIAAVLKRAEELVREALNA